MWFEKVKNWRKKKRVYPAKSPGRPRLQLNEKEIREAYQKGMKISENKKKNKCAETTIRRRLGL